MRTTLTLDDDVARGLAGEARRGATSFKRTVNDLLREALAARRRPAARPPFRIAARDLGLRPGFDLSDAWGAVQQAEGSGPR